MLKWCGIFCEIIRHWFVEILKAPAVSEADTVLTN